MKQKKEFSIQEAAKILKVSEKLCVGGKQEEYLSLPERQADIEDMISKLLNCWKAKNLGKP